MFPWGGALPSAAISYLPTYVGEVLGQSKQTSHLSPVRKWRLQPGSARANLEVQHMRLVPWYTLESWQSLDIWEMAPLFLSLASSFPPLSLLLYNGFQTIVYSLFVFYRRQVYNGPFVHSGQSYLNY